MQIKVSNTLKNNVTEDLAEGRWVVKPEATWLIEQVTCVRGGSLTKKLQ